ncbi:putative integral membrane protein (TIGR00698 family) [Planomicrobium soli]|uniref:Putative integral membrane protein (TIGR00698 family) n=1 Tax=Planomicrobium soli TaxID=1176648 RepID=A0A2P8H5G2_9BACL|nr:putative sulfate exporter family transporter [Planomicrobium soli]PSL41448.1 putative integral membrane protein (TIGR00698 family) [Planomicrobium soli]
MATSTRNDKVIGLIPGLIACFIVMLIGIVGAAGIGELLLATGILADGSASPISGIFVAILLGIIIRNTLGLPDFFKTGINFSVKYALRAGIILLGLRLSLIEALKLGAWGVPLIVACISVGLFVTLYFTSKLEQSNRLGTLIATGTGICGVTAIMATAPVINAKENEISYAVANITIFGLIGMLFYPYLAHFFFADEPIKAGLFLGTAIHDTAQVTGAALIYGQLYDSAVVVDVATITKLTRNVFIIAVVPFISFLFFRNKAKSGESKAESLPKWYKLFPVFILGFLFLSLMRTTGDATASSSGAAFSLISPAAWESFYSFWSSFGSTYMLGLAMAGVGLSTNLKIFKGLGIKPFYIGLIAALSVGAVSLLLISLFGDLISI